MSEWAGKNLHFVTGRLAERALRKSLEKISRTCKFSYTVDVLRITVAALMTPKWVAQRVTVPEDADCVIIPGYCSGDLDLIREKVGCPVLRGPRDLRRLGIFFNQTDRESESYGNSDIEIIAEINHAPKLSLREINEAAKQLSSEGANLIDLGCNPGETWAGVADAVKSLKDLGCRVSIDSMNVHEIEQAVSAGAELVLSVNSSNREASVDWGVEVVVVPDDPSRQETLDETIDYLASRGVPLRIDPILSPIGFGFAESLNNYLKVRDRYVDAEIMMGIGNLTELTDTDSHGINTILLGFCQEIGIRSVLTTAVIAWAKHSIRECDIARKLVYHAVQHGVLPKHLDDRLVMLHDVDRPTYNEGFFDDLAANIRDHNIRLFVDETGIHLVSRDVHLTDRDPFRLFQHFLNDHCERMDIGHSFYLGYELSKAMTALTLGKNYQQDEALDWGFLTLNEAHRTRIKDRRESID